MKERPDWSGRASKPRRRLGASMQSPAARVAFGALVVLSALLAGCQSTEDAGPGGIGRPVTASEAPPPTFAPGAMGGHIHDYWNDETSRVLMDSAVSVTVVHNHLLDEPPRPQHLHNCAEETVSTSQGGSVTFTLPSGEIVPPGTERLEFTFTWSDPTVTGVRFYYRPPSHGHTEGGDGHDHSNLTDAGRLESGVPVVLPLTSGMADLGHDTQSHWAFYVCSDTENSPNLAQGSIRMEVVAFRVAELTPDPPHPDHWLGASRLMIAHYNWTGSTWSALNQGEGTWHHLALHPGAVVPMGTHHVTVEAWMNATGPAADALPGRPLLYYKDSTQVDWIYKAVEGEPDGTKWTFLIPVEDFNALDSPYASRSNWDFWLRILSDTDAAAPASLGRYGAPYVADVELSAVVAIHAP